MFVKNPLRSCDVSLLGKLTSSPALSLSFSVAQATYYTQAALHFLHLTFTFTYFLHVSRSFEHSGIGIMELHTSFQLLKSQGTGFEVFGIQVGHAFQELITSPSTQYLLIPTYIRKETKQNKNSWDSKPKLPLSHTLTSKPHILLSSPITYIIPCFPDFLCSLSSDAWN